MRVCKLREHTRQHSYPCKLRHDCIYDEVYHWLLEANCNGAIMSYPECVELVERPPPVQKIALRWRRPQTDFSMAGIGIPTCSVLLSCFLRRREKLRCNHARARLNALLSRGGLSSRSATYMREPSCCSPHIEALMWKPPRGNPYVSTLMWGILVWEP